MDLDEAIEAIRHDFVPEIDRPIEKLLERLGELVEKWQGNKQKFIEAETETISRGERLSFTHGYQAGSIDVYWVCGEQLEGLISKAEGK